MASLGYKPLPLDQESQDRTWDSVWNGLNCSARTCPPMSCRDEGKVRSWIREWEGDLRWLWINQITVRPASVSIKMPPADLWKQFVEVNRQYNVFKEIFPDQGWRKQFADVDEFVQKSFDTLLGNGPPDGSIGIGYQAVEQAALGSPTSSWSSSLDGRNSPGSDGFDYYYNYAETTPPTSPEGFGSNDGLSDGSGPTADEFTDSIILPGTPMLRLPPSPVIGRPRSQSDGYIHRYSNCETLLSGSPATTPPTPPQSPVLEPVPIQILASPRPSAVLPQTISRSHPPCSCSAAREYLPSEQRTEQSVVQRQRCIEWRQSEILRLQGETLHAVSDIGSWMTIRGTGATVHINCYASYN